MQPGKVGPLDITQRLRGLAPWGVRLGTGSFLTFEFGQAEAGPPGSITHGEFHLWVYMCNWRLETAGKLLVGSDDERPAIEAALESLKFGEAEEIELVNPSLDLGIQFHPEPKLLTFSATFAQDQPQWMLFTPEGYCLTVFGDGTHEFTPRTAPRPRS